MIKILQGSVVTQTVLDWPLTKKLYILQLVISYNADLPKKYNSWLPVDNVISTIINSLLSGPPCIKMQDFRICHTDDLKSKDITQVETG